MMDTATFLRLVQADPPPSESADEVASPPATENLALSNAKASLIRRRFREKLFGEARLVEGPAWEMLVDLYVSHLETTPLCVGSLCVTSGVPMTNAVRVLGKLVDAGMVVRNPDPCDKRRCVVSLSADTIGKLDTYFGSELAAD